MTRIETIVAGLEDYDPLALPVTAVHDFLDQLIEPVAEHENASLFEALGRVLSHDVISPLNVPPHDNSALDGFAFHGTALAGTAPLVLNVVGTALAGQTWIGPVGAEQCVKIMTGAAMPAGLDTVVPQEWATLVDYGRGATITIPAGLLHAGDNRRCRGEDLMQGQPALRQGALLTPAALGLVASMGLDTVRVWRQLRVAYFSTGDELLSLGESPRAGTVFDSNRYTLFGLLTRLGCRLIDMGVVRDEPAALEAAFLRAAAEADVIITSGGVSVGEADHTKAMLQKLGDVVLWKIAMRPGRPMAVGHLPKGTPALQHHAPRASSDHPRSSASASGSALLFGLPGNPVAVMVTFLAFVRPALLKMMGCTAPPPPLIKARSLAPLRKTPGRTEYQRGIVSRAADGSLHVKSTGPQGSGILRSMVQANGLIVLPHAQGNVAPGDEVDVMMFEGVI